jgi:hypothetical protein
MSNISKNQPEHSPTCLILCDPLPFPPAMLIPKISYFSADRSLTTTALSGDSISFF